MCPLTPFRRILPYLAIGLIPTFTFGVDRTFNTSGSDWFTPTSWTGSTVPGSSDKAIIGGWSSNKSITFGAGTATINRLQIGNTSNSGNITIGSVGDTGTITFTGSGARIAKAGFKWDVINPLVIIDANTLFINEGGGTWDSGAGRHGSLTFAGGMTIKSGMTFSKQPSQDTPIYIGGNLTMEDNSLFDKNVNGHVFFQGQKNIIKGGLINGVHNMSFQGENFMFTGNGRGVTIDDPDLGETTLPGFGLTVNSGEVRFGYGSVANVTNESGAALSSTSQTPTNVFFTTRLVQNNGTINIGDSTNSTDSASQARRTANFTIHASNLEKNNGTLRLQYGTGNGTTTILGGDVIAKTATAPTGSSVTIANTTGLVEGMRVYGPGIAADTLITSISGGTVTFNKTLSNSALVGELMFGEGIHNQTGTGAANANTLTVTNGSKFKVGQTITGTGIRTGTTITGISGNVLTLDSTLTQAVTSTAIKSYAPGTLRFGGSSIGNIGATIEVLRGVSNQGEAYGRVLFDPSLHLLMEGRAYVNFSDNQGTIENFVFKSIHSDNSGALDGDFNNQTHQNQLTNVKKVAGSPFIVFESGYTNIVNGSEIAGPGIQPGSRVIGIYANSVLLDKPVTLTASGVGSTALIRNHTSLISDRGNAKLTIGNYSTTNDVFDGRLHFSSSGAESMLVKVGSNTLTLSGKVDNSGSRIRVDEGTVVLAKESNAYVRTVGSNLIIGDADSAFEIVRLEGSFNTSVTHSRYANYNEQIYGSARVQINATGFLDLNGFDESIGYLYTAPGVQGGFIGNTSSRDATLILSTRTDQSYNSGGTNNADSYITIQDGGYNNAGTPVAGGKVNLEFAGGGTQYLRGPGTYSGYTHVSRGNLTFIGPDAALTNSKQIRVSNGTLFFNNREGVNQNRINDDAEVVLRNGTLTVTNQASNGVTEKFATLKLDGGANVLRLQHGGAEFNRLRYTIDNYVYTNGSGISIVENLDNQGNATTQGIGFAFRGDNWWTEYDGNSGYKITPADAYTQLVINNMPGDDVLIGGTTLNRNDNNYAYSTKNLKILMGATGSHAGNRTREFMTVDTVNGVHYIRPLDSNEYFSPATSVTTENTNRTDVSRFDNTKVFKANNAYNSMRFAGQHRTTIDLDKVIKIGDGDSILGYNPSGHIGAGMLNIIDYNAGMFGGYLDFGAREIWVRGQSNFVMGASMVSSIQINPDDPNPTVGFFKHGGGLMDLWGNNVYEGETYVVQGGLRVNKSSALGLGGAGNEIRLVTSGYDGDTLGLNNGVVIGDLNNPNLRKNVILEFDARLSSYDQNNTLAGDVIVASATETGRTITSYLRTRRHSGALTIEGSVYGTNPFDSTGRYRGVISDELNANQAGRVIAFIGDNRNDGIINVEGAIADYAVDGVPTFAMNEKDRMIVLVRGATGDAGRAAPINDFHVNVNNMENVTGYLDLRSGFLRSQTSYGTGMIGTNAVGGNAHTMVMRLRDNSSQNPNQVAVLSFTNRAASQLGYEPINPVDMSKGGAPQRANVNQITWTDGDGGYSASSYGMIANEGKGRLIVGNGYGTLDMNPAADIAFSSAGNYYYRKPVDYDEQGNVLSTPLTTISGTSLNLGSVGEFDNGFDLTKIQVGMIVSGAGVPEGTRVKSVNPTTGVVAFESSAATPADVTVTLTPESSLTFSGTQTATVSSATRHASYTSLMILDSNLSGGLTWQNIRPGTLLTGTNVPNSTYVMQVFAPGTIFGPDGITTVFSAYGAVLLNNALSSATASNIIFNDAIPNSDTTQRYADARLYAALGGEIDLRLRVLDDGGFSLENEVGAVTKVGRGYGRLSGVPGAVGELDGGLNLHGGTLILDYRVNPGRKVTSGDNHQAPLTLSGGNLWMLGNATNTPDAEDAPIPSATTEQIRGIIFARPGASTIRVTSGGIHDTRLDLGVPNNLAGGFDMAPVVYAGGTFNFWKDQSAGGTAIITMNLLSSQRNQPLPFAVYTNTQTGKVTEFAYFAVQVGANSLNYVEGSLGSTAGNTHFALTNMANAQSTNYGGTGFGYIREQALGDGQPVADGVGYYGTLQSGKHLRAVIFNQQNVQGTNATSGGFVNGVMNLGGPTVMLNTEQLMNGYGTKHGGAILITSGIGSSNKTIQGGSLSSLFKTTVWNPKFTEVEESTYSLYIHNYADPAGGMFIVNTDLADPGKVDARDTNNQPIQTFGPDFLPVPTPDLPMNLVHSGTGKTKMARAYDGGAGYSYTGSTYLNGGSVWSKSPGSEIFDIETLAPATLWVSDPNKLGANPTSMDSDNIYFNGGRLRLASMTATNANGTEGSTIVDNIDSKTITLNSNRGITIGGQGAYIDVVAAGTTFVIDSPILTEVHSPTFAASQTRPSNLGIGDLIKEGAGTLQISNPNSSFSGILDIQAGKLIAKIGDNGAATASADPNAYTTALNESKNLYGVLGSSYSYIDGTFVNPNTELRFEITGNTSPDLLNRRFRNGTAEYITLDGGTLGTTAAHTGGVLQGMIRVRQNSTIDIVGDTSKVLRFNAHAGMMTSEGALPGMGHLTKTGGGTLELWENNTPFRGNWHVKEGRVLGMSQGRPFGTGDTIVIGDAAHSSGTVEVLLGSRMAHSFTIEEVAMRPVSGATNTSYMDTIIGDGAGVMPNMAGVLYNKTTKAVLWSGTMLSQENTTTLRMSTSPAGVNNLRGILEVSHTAELPVDYHITQNILIAASGQKKVIGAANHQSLYDTGMNWDRYLYTGNIQLQDDVYLSYKDNVNNKSLVRRNGSHGAANTNGLGGTSTGRDQVIALNGNISDWDPVSETFLKKNIRTEIEYAGDTTALNSTDLRIYFEMNGNNSSWSGALVAGNGLEGNADLDKRHIVRFGTNNPTATDSVAIGAQNEVYMTSNSTLQTGGKNVTIGNLRVATLNTDGSSTPLTVAAGTGALTGNQAITIENASDVAGKITITQEETADWNVLFRDGVTDPHYITDVNNTVAGPTSRDKSLSVVKAGGTDYQEWLILQGIEVGTAVMTQNNEYTGTTTVQFGNLQVGRGGNSETVHNVGRTGTGATTVMAGAAISGTGLINGTANTTNHVLQGIMRPGDAGGASRGTLTINGNLTTQNNTSNISFNILNATKNATNFTELGGFTALDLGVGGANYGAALDAIAATWGNTNPTAGSHDHVQINGKLTLGGETTVQVIGDEGVTFEQGDVYNLLDWSSVDPTTFSTGGNQVKGGPISGSEDLLLPLLSGDLWWDTSKFLSHGLLIVVGTTVVPEPSKGILVMIAVGAIVLRRRRAA